jgi:6-phosphogluconolactonase
MERLVKILEGPRELSRAAAEAFLDGIRGDGEKSVVLAGGSTPRELYALLALRSEKFFPEAPWGRLHFFWGDERHVPPDHPESNYRMAWETLLSRVPVPESHVHRVRGELADPFDAAQEYESAIRIFFRLEPGELPRFDLVLLGMGADGHTASLFPCAGAEAAAGRICQALWVGGLGAYRITLTSAVFNNAASVVFLVSGAEKAEALHAVLKGEEGPDRFPAKLISPARGRLLWLVDREAARSCTFPRSSAS